MIWVPEEHEEKDDDEDDDEPPVPAAVAKSAAKKTRTQVGEYLQRVDLRSPKESKKVCRMDL